METVNVKDSRCVEKPDCDGLWIQLVFEPAYNENTPSRYMISSSKVYSIQGDWAVLLSGDKQSVPTRTLTEAISTRWIHIPLMSVIEIQNKFLLKPISTKWNSEETADEEWKGIYLTSEMRIVDLQDD